MTSESQATNQLAEYLSQLGPAAVAVSGGVDSMTLGVLAHRVNPNIEIFHAVSPAVPVQATERVKKYASQENWRLKIIDAGEIEDPDYLANPANRCYFCKTNLYDTIVASTSSLVLSGTNIDDLGDYRPGLSAAQEHQVCHPYVECGVSKASLRQIALNLGLTDLHDLPAAPCLSSRIETGITINPNVLPVINEVEEQIWNQRTDSQPLSGVRCRVRASGIVIELETDTAISDNQAFVQQAMKIATDCFARAGFTDIAESVSVEPYQRGSAFLIETLAVEP